MKTTVKVECHGYGNVKFNVGQGYIAIRHENIAAFHFDVEGGAYPFASSDKVYFPETKELKSYPSFSIESAKDEDSLGDVWFPEFEGWRVHSFTGGKTISVCLVKLEQS